MTKNKRKREETEGSQSGSTSETSSSAGSAQQDKSLEEKSAQHASLRKRLGELRKLAEDPILEGALDAQVAALAKRAAEVQADLEIHEPRCYTEGRIVSERNKVKEQLENKVLDEKANQQRNAHKLGSLKERSEEPAVPARAAAQAPMPARAREVRAREARTREIAARTWTVQGKRPRRMTFADRTHFKAKRARAAAAVGRDREPSRARGRRVGVDEAALSGARVAADRRREI